MTDVINFDDKYIERKCRELSGLLQRYEDHCMMEIDLMIKEDNRRKIANGLAYVNDNERTIGVVR